MSGDMHGLSDHGVSDHGLPDHGVSEHGISEQRLAQVLVDIKRNSRNRRIAMVAPLLLAAAVVGAMLAAPPQHGGLALTADAETPDPQLPRVFGSNGVWRLAEPIETDPAGDPGPASVIEAQTEPSAPAFSLSPPDQEELNSLPTSTSTPPTSTSGQSLDAPTDAGDPAESPSELDWSSFSAVIRIEPAAAEIEAPTDDTATGDTATETGENADAADIAAAPAPEVSEPQVSEPEAGASEETSSTPVPLTEDTTTPDGVIPDENSSDENGSDQSDDDATVAVEPQTEIADPDPANPSTPVEDPTDSEPLAFSAPASIVPQSVLVYSAHVSVTVQVVDDDSSVVDWCNTRVDWGDGSVTRVAGADDDALCTASCEYQATSSAAGSSTGSDDTLSNNAASNNAASNTAASINEQIVFEHDYAQTIDASPRIFVATGDGCSYTLAELQLPPFTVVPLP